MVDPKQILGRSRAVLLVDWPNPKVARALLGAGLAVFGYSPRRYSRAEIVAIAPPELHSHNIFPPQNENETGYLIFRAHPGRPAPVDIVCVYRPAEEAPEILAAHVLPLRAKVLWLLGRRASAEELALAREHNLELVEDADIAAAARATQRAGK